MVLPTPFERLLQETAKLANQDPQGAFARLDELYGKSLSEQEVLQLSGFAVHLGTGSLARYEETAAFLRRLLSHPGIAAGSVAARSLWRALAVVLTLAGRREEFDEACRQGVTNRSEECRLAIMSAQLLSVRGRADDAIAQLRRATLLCRELAADDEVLSQVATVSAHLLRMAEPQVRMAQDMLLAAAAAHGAALGRHADWHHNHRAWFQHGHAYLLAGRPTQALRCVQAMMELEDVHQAGPFERFHTASLAARAQAIRGQRKIAAAALEACQDFASRVEQPAQSKAVAEALKELQTFVSAQGGD